MTELLILAIGLYSLFFQFTPLLWECVCVQFLHRCPPTGDQMKEYSFKLGFEFTLRSTDEG